MCQYVRTHMLGVRVYWEQGKIKQDTSSQKKSLDTNDMILYLKICNK